MRTMLILKWGSHVPDAGKTGKTELLELWEDELRPIVRDDCGVNTEVKCTDGEPSRSTSKRKTQQNLEKASMQTSK